MKLVIAIVITLALAGCRYDNPPYKVVAKTQNGSRCSLTMFTSEPDSIVLYTREKEEYCGYNVGDVLK